MCGGRSVISPTIIQEGCCSSVRKVLFLPWDTSSVDSGARQKCQLYALIVILLTFLYIRNRREFYLYFRVRSDMVAVFLMC